MDQDGRLIGKRKKFIWTEQQTDSFIRLRMKNDALFTGYRNASLQGFYVLIKEMRLEGCLSAPQAAKKWENLKKKYRNLMLPQSGTGMEAGQVITTNWPHFEAMHRALGPRDAISAMEPQDDNAAVPLDLIAAVFDDSYDVTVKPEDDESTAAAASSHSSPEPSSSFSATRLPTTSTTAPGPSSLFAPGLPTSATSAPEPGPSRAPDQQPRGPAGGKMSRKRTNELVACLREYADRQEKRQKVLDEKEEERENNREEQMDRLIGLFGKMVEKMDMLIGIFGRLVENHSEKDK